MKKAQKEEQKNREDKRRQEKTSTEYLGGDSAVDPPNSMPNLEVKRCNADGSVGLPHVRVGHRQV